MTIVNVGLSYRATSAGVTAYTSRQNEAAAAPVIAAGQSGVGEREDLGVHRRSRRSRPGRTRATR